METNDGGKLQEPEQPDPETLAAGIKRLGRFIQAGVKKGTPGAKEAAIAFGALARLVSDLEGARPSQDERGGRLRAVNRALEASEKETKKAARTKKTKKADSRKSPRKGK